MNSAKIIFFNDINRILKVFSRLLNIVTYIRDLINILFSINTVDIY